MENIVEFPSCDAIEDEALHWLIRLDGDKPLSATEERTFDAWLARSPAHREALTSLNSFWSSCNVLGELATPPSIIALCRKHFLAIFWPSSTLAKGRVAFTAFASLLMAVALGIAVGGLLGERDITGSNGLYLTAVGQQKTITLDDNSQVQLNTNSQIRVDYSGAYRNIRLLQGEVHFEVAKDPEKPFRVYAGSGRVQAVGTAFNVYLNNDDINVFVTEGRVAVASILPVVAPAALNTAGTDTATTKPFQVASTEERALIAVQSNSRDDYAKTKVNGLGLVEAGQAVILQKTQKPLSGTAAENAESQTLLKMLPTDDISLQKQNRRLSWRQGLLIFSGETLEEVIAEISRYTSVEIEIINPELRDIAIGGQIQVSDTDSLFKAMEANFGLKVKRLSYNRVQVIAVSE